MQKKPSVVFFNRVYPPVRGATGRVLRDLARGFARDGWQVTVVTTGSAAAKERDGLIRIIRVKAPLKGKTIGSYLRVWLKMYWAGSRLPRPDLIVSMTDPPMLAVAGDMIARAKRCPHIHWCQDLYPDILPALGINLSDGLTGYLKKLMRRTLLRCDRTVVIGRCMARHLIRMGLEARRITVIPNWPDYELLAPNRVTRRPLNGKAAFLAAQENRLLSSNGGKLPEPLFQDKELRFRILYSGTLGRAHPIQTIFDAAQILNHSNPEIEFVFVGEGPVFERLAVERMRRGLENIRLLPYQPASRLRELMESGDVHLITMKHEAAGFLVPCKLYAALTVGRPCILVGPNHSEVARVIDDFQAGAIVAQGEPQKLAQAILRYRMDGEAWFAAHEGARKAGRMFVPYESISAWISRARNVAGFPSSRRQSRADIRSQAA